MHMNPVTQSIRCTLMSGALILAMGPSAIGALWDPGASRASTHKERATEATSTNEASRTFAERLTTYSASVDDLTPEEAAHHWLSLYDAMDTPAEKRRPRFSVWSHEQDSNFAKLMEALPGPASWPALSHAINERPGKTDDAAARETALLILAAALSADYDTARELVDLLTAQVYSLPKRQGDQLGRSVDELIRAINVVTADPGRLLSELSATIRQQEANPRDRILDIPDLVTLVGADEAEPVIRRALRLPLAMVRVPLGNDTLHLTRQLALEMIDELKYPQWTLVSSLDAIPLYEALRTRFEGEPVKAEPSHDTLDTSHIISIDSDFDGDVDISDYVPAGLGHDIILTANLERERRRAELFYIFSLIAEDRTAEAANAATILGEKQPESGSLPQAALRQLERAGYLQEVYEFIRAMLQTNPDLHYWTDLVALGAKANRPDETRDFILKTIGQEDLSESTRQRLLVVAYQAQLAADEVDDAVVRMRELLAWSADVERKSLKEIMPIGRITLATQLARIGHVTGNSEWMEEGLRIAGKEMSDGKEDSQGVSIYRMKPLLSLLLETERFDEAEALLQEEIRAAGKSDSIRWHDPRNELLVALAELYVLADRTDEILALLDENPYWGADDLASRFTAVSVNMPLGYAAALALHRAGRTTEALPMLEALLQAQGGYDPAYALYADIRGLDAVPFLDDLLMRDQFEERPLIWKAHVLRQAGRLDEAEAAAVKAIAIDPSDGEQGRGDRMRVYAEMGQIEQARGNEEKAEFFANVMRAIRLAEDADQVYEAGLLKRGIRMYREALDFFRDAYCIQSRMAIQLEQAGDFAAAEEHYLKAYELMPDSFGRVESHCFGCEGVFVSPRAQNSAERVFGRLYTEMPDKPQVPYLLGYLRYTQRDYETAARLFREALALDPDYLSAWGKLGDVGQRIQLPPRDRDAVTLNQIRLDPNHRHVRPRYDQVYELSALWEVIAAAEERRVSTPDTLYPLTASARENARRKDDHIRRTFYSHNLYGKAVGPAEAISRQAVVQAVIQFMSAAR